MITSIEINGFKTFRDFKMEFSPLTVIAGTNATGKSNLFDALSLLSRIAETDLRTAFSEQRGSAAELFTQYDDANFETNMDFAVEVLLNKQVRDNWGKSANLKYTRLRYQLSIKIDKKENGLEDLIITAESLVALKHDEDAWVSNFIKPKLRTVWRPKVATGRRGFPYIETEDSRSIILRQDGSGGGKKEFPISPGITQTILSSINSVDFPHAFALKQELISWKFLQLNPQALREPTRQEIGMRDVITQNGENLAAALWRIKINDNLAIKNISRKLNNILPSLVEVNVYNDPANKQFIIKIKNEDGRWFSSRVLSEGTLRLLALCVFQYDDLHNGLLCFEEPENGVHPARLKEMAALLCDLSVDFSDAESPLRQVVINTHSPILVNELFELKKDNTTVWLSQLVTTFVNIGKAKIKIHVSKIIPVDPDTITDSNNQGRLNFPDEAKLALTQLRNYLEYTDVEKTTKEFSTNE